MGKRNNNEVARARATFSLEKNCGNQELTVIVLPNGRRLRSLSIENPKELVAILNIARHLPDYELRELQDLLQMMINS